MAVLPRKHLRDEKSRYQGVCGAGYPWPSSIGLVDDIGFTTCPDCLARCPWHPQEQCCPWEGPPDGCGKCSCCREAEAKNPGVRYHPE